MAMPTCPASLQPARGKVAGGILIIVLALGRARAGIIPDNNFAQIDAAISRGDVDEAERLASAALALPDLSKRDKSQLLSDRALALNLNGV
jgi:hypothetical protein